MDDPGNPTVNFHGEERRNDTHQSTSDPEAKLARKGPGKEAKLSYSGNLLVENGNGLVVKAEVFEANGTAERDAALDGAGESDLQEHALAVAETKFLNNEQGELFAPLSRSGDGPSTVAPNNEEVKALSELVQLGDAPACNVCGALWCEVVRVIGA